MFGGPFYTQASGNMFEAVEAVLNSAVFPFWNGGEGQTFDLRAGLANAECPVLVFGGELDPVCPIAGSEELVAALSPGLVRFERFATCGHGVFRDDPLKAFRILRDFINDRPTASGLEGGPNR